MQLEKKVDEFRKLNLSQTPRRRLYCRIPIIWSLVKKKPYSVTFDLALEDRFNFFRLQSLLFGELILYSTSLQYA